MTGKKKSLAYTGGSSNTINAAAQATEGFFVGANESARPRHPTWSHSLNIQERPRSRSLSVNRSTQTAAAGPVAAALLAAKESAAVKSKQKITFSVDSREINAASGGGGKAKKFTAGAGTTKPVGVEDRGINKASIRHASTKTEDVDAICRLSSSTEH